MGAQRLRRARRDPRDYVCAVLCISCCGGVCAPPSCGKGWGEGTGKHTACEPYPHLPTLPAAQAHAPRPAPFFRLSLASSLSRAHRHTHKAVHRTTQLQRRLSLLLVLLPHSRIDHRRVRAHIRLKYTTGWFRPRVAAYSAIASHVADSSLSRATRMPDTFPTCLTLASTPLSSTPVPPRGVVYCCLRAIYNCGQV